MKITNRKSQLLTKSNYYNKLIKTEKIHEVYTDNAKTPVIRYKTVELKYPLYELHIKRPKKRKLIIGKSDESDTEYANLKEKRKITFDHHDGCMERYKAIKVQTNNTNIPLRKYEAIEFRYPYGTIDKDESYDYKLIFDKIDASDFKDESPYIEDIKTENVFDLYEMC